MPAIRPPSSGDWYGGEPNLALQLALGVVGALVAGLVRDVGDDLDLRAAAVPQGLLAGLRQLDLDGVGSLVEVGAPLSDGLVAELRHELHVGGLADRDLHRQLLLLLDLAELDPDDRD